MNSSIEPRSDNPSSKRKISSDTEILAARSASYQDALSHRDRTIEDYRSVIRSLLAFGLLAMLTVVLVYVRIEYKLRVTPSDVSQQIQEFKSDLTSARLYDLYIRNSDEAIVVVDPQGIVLLWSAGMKELCGTPPQNAVGLGLAGLLMEQDKEKHIAGYARAMRSTDPYRKVKVRCSIRTAEGHILPIQVDAFAVPKVGSIAHITLLPPEEMLGGKNPIPLFTETSGEVFPVADALR